MLGDTLRGKDVLVTGGAGFIGSHLVDRLIELGARITLTVRRGATANLAATAVTLDVTDYSQVEAIVKGRELIFHLAANATTKESSMGWMDPFFDYRVNVLGTLNLLEAVTRLRGRPRIVYTSTAAVYGVPEHLPLKESHPTRPISPHGVSKLAAEHYCHAYGHERALDIVTLRLFSVYGPRQRRYAIHDLLAKLQRNPHHLEVLGTGEQRRDYCFVSDAVDGLIIAAEQGRAGDVCNLATGRPVVLRDLVDRLVSISGLTAVTSISFTGHTWEGDIPQFWGDATRLQRLGFRPKVDLDEGLRCLHSWMNETAQAVRGSAGV